MRTFQCEQCARGVFFENVKCLGCGSDLGFDPATMSLETLAPGGSDGARFSRGAIGASRRVMYCNNAVYGVCNWLRPAEDPTGLCVACDLNRTIPNLENTENLEAWRTLEVAKKRLVYSLLKFKLPLRGTYTAPQPLTFDFLRDATTGHLDGVVTISANEADAVEREKQRKQLDESYRTVLGHMRHEVGHYYWSILIDGTPNLDEFRRLFGDEQASYDDALNRHYTVGPPADWQLRHVSSYASSHPWEDWSETWAHYLHMVDALETADSVGMKPRAALFELGSAWIFPRQDAYRNKFDQLVERWIPLTVALNSINRSMGHQDFYPFVISDIARQKLGFVHDIIRRNAT